MYVIFTEIYNDFVRIDLPLYTNMKMQYVWYLGVTYFNEYLWDVNMFEGEIVAFN
jgi:hypothetical protein